MDWAEKYRPEHLKDVIGNTQTLGQMLSWARNWTPRSKPLLLYGKPGTGKTSSAHALARDMKWEVVELNASDQRTKALLEKVAGSSSTTASISGAARHLILLDEVDNLHGTADRGGAKALLEIIRRSAQPIILIANNLQGVPSELRMQCEPIVFRAVQSRSILPRLKFICSSEGVRCSEKILKEISEASGGDVRAAISMLSAVAMGEKEVSEADLEISMKDERATIFDLVSRVFRSEPDEELLRTAMDIVESPDDIQQWLEGSIPHLQDGEAISAGYRALSKADLFTGRVLRRQYYTLWRYAQAISLVGVSAAAGGRVIHERIMPPPRWHRMSTLRRQKALRNALLKKLSERLHIPPDELRNEYLTSLSLLVEADPERFVLEFALDTEELNLFIHDRKKATEIMKRMSERGPVVAGAKAGSAVGDAEEEKRTRRGKQARQKQTTLF
ncbi:MAG: replication factor C large subunit [Methanomicrobiales archaeon]|nr:replication factor C large subunit [Methanomicrobiales archaeon]